MRLLVAGEGTMAGAAVLRRAGGAGCGWEDGPEAVVVCAGRAGGIEENRRHPADLLEDNLIVQIDAFCNARIKSVQRLVYLASACVYPRECPQPMREEHLMTGSLEPTSEAYATAKLTGIAHLRALNRQRGTRWTAAIPDNLYGPGDDFDPERGHVVSSMMARMHALKGTGRPLAVWGTGTPRRSFLHVDDLADAVLFLLGLDDPPEVVNIASGQDVSIAGLAEEMRGVVGFEGGITFDPSKPDGAPRKVLDGSRLAALGWRSRIPLREGLRSTYDGYARV